MSRTADLILVTWNQLAYTRRCVESLFRHTAVPYRLLIVDNGSQPDTIAYLDALQRDHPDRVLCLKQPANLGWVGGVNAGLKAATAPYVCLLNNDLVLLPGWLERMIAVAESDPTIGLVNPTYNASGEPLESFTRRISSGESGGWPPGYLELGECNGACLLIRRRVLEAIGGLDERYGTDGMDDSDFSRRAELAGFRCVRARRAWVFHWENVSCNTVPDYWSARRPRGLELFRQRWGERKQIMVVLSGHPDEPTVQALRHGLALARLGVRVHVLGLVPRGSGWDRAEGRWRLGLPEHNYVKWTVWPRSGIGLLDALAAAWALALAAAKAIGRRHKQAAHRIQAFIVPSAGLRRALQMLRWLHRAPVASSFAASPALRSNLEPRTLSARLEKRLLKWMAKGFRPLASTRRYGWREALGYGSELDHWLRYAPVVETLRVHADSAPARGPFTVLDIGGGPAGLASLLRDRRFRVIALDPNTQALRGNPALKVVGDGCRLPLADRSADIAVSVDALEHVPAEGRRAFLEELGRVARELIVMHCPIDSADGRFRGSRYDRIFQRLHRRLFGVEEANTAEHLQYGLPTLELVRSVFPAARIEGRQNGRVWLRHMVGGRRRWHRLANGLRYLWVLKAHDDQPPFHGALMVVERAGQGGPSLDSPPGAARSGRPGLEEPSKPGRKRLSVVILTKNEESRIGRCLSHLRWADDLVVVDGFSRDRTVELCRQAGACVIQREFGGSFAEERNAGLDAATGDWVLQLDADDVVSLAMREAVERLLREDDGTYDVYKFRRRSVFLGHPLAFGAWTHYIPHLVRRTAVRYTGRVHERPDAPEPFGIIDADVDHHFCERFADFIVKVNRYSGLSARMLLERDERRQGRRFCSKQLLRPLELFWKVFVKKRGYRDGLFGLVMALQNSWTHLITFGKYWELALAAPGERPQPSLTEQLDALNASSSREAEAWTGRHPRAAAGPLAWRMALEPAGVLCAMYLRRGGRHGLARFMPSLFTAYGRFLLRVKCWERIRRVGPVE